MSLVSTINRIVLLTCLSIPLSGIVNAAENDARKPIPLAKALSQAEPWVGEYIAAYAPDEVYDFLTAHPTVVVHADAWTFLNDDKTIYCAVKVGLTQRELNDMQEREPITNYYSASLVPESAGKYGEEGCRGLALKRALTHLFEKDIEDLKNSLAEQFKPGTKRPKEKWVATNYNYWGSGFSDNGYRYLEDKLPGWYHHVFDFRYTNMYALTKVLEVENGQKICLAVLGLTTTARPGTPPRYPVERNAYAKLFPLAEIDDAEKDEYCFNPLWDKLMSKLTFDSNVVTSFVKNWKLVGEPDLTPLTEKSVQAKYDQWQKKQEQEQAAAAKREAAEERKSQTRTVTRTSCTNDCYNGDCVRTFPNGKKERWQAPRKYNAMSGNWEWDTSSNACGG